MSNEKSTDSSQRHSKPTTAPKDTGIDDSPNPQLDEDVHAQSASTDGSSKPEASEDDSEQEKLLSNSDEPADQLASIYDSGSPVPPSKVADKEASLGGRMTFLEHLDELRRRIFFSLTALVLATGACWFFREQIFVFMKGPGASTITDFELVYTKVTDTFTIWLKVAVAGGIFLSSPFILSQVWFFISPGLYRKEKRYAIPFLVSSTLLFLTGGAFAYLVILPASLGFLVNNLGSSLKPMITAVDYFSFVVLILVGMGTVFQLPVVVAFLSLFGLVTPRFLWKNFRYAILIIFILAAIVSPTADALNLTFWAAPMLALYVASIGVSWVFNRPRPQAEE
jgi:sec-independent protein translocase protein TatC